MKAAERIGLMEVEVDLFEDAVHFAQFGWEEGRGGTLQMTDVIKAEVVQHH